MDYQTDDGVEIVPGLEFGHNKFGESEPLDRVKYSSYGTLEEIERRASDNFYDSYKKLLKNHIERVESSLSSKNKRTLEEILKVLTIPNIEELSVSPNLLQILRSFGVGFEAVGKIDRNRSLPILLKYRTYRYGSEYFISVSVDRGLNESNFRYYYTSSEE